MPKHQLKLNLNRIASAALAAACVVQAWRRGGTQTALAVAVGVAVLLAMIWFSRGIAASMPRRGSSMLGTPDAHHVEPLVFTLLG